MKHKVDGHPNAYKDSESGAIVFSDNKYLQVKKRKEIAKNKDVEIFQLRKDITQLQNDINTIMKYIKEV